MVATLLFGKHKDVFRRVNLFVKGKQLIVIRTANGSPYDIRLILQNECKIRQ